MSDAIVVDARGLSCPQPVLETKTALEKSTGDRVEILVDTVTSKENVSRFARSRGWTPSWEETPEGSFKVIMTR
jgi:TusA-related sulfurtransferase